MKLITLKSFDASMDAHLLKSKLEFNNIRCYLKDEYTAESNHLYSNAIGGIKLQINEKDLEAAKLVMREMGIQIAQNAENISCPSCQSPTVQKGATVVLKSKGIKRELHQFFSGILPFMYKKTFLCVNCGQQFLK